MQIKKIIPGKWYQTTQGIGKALSVSVAQKRVRLEFPNELTDWIPIADFKYEIPKGEEEAAIAEDRKTRDEAALAEEQAAFPKHQPADATPNATRMRQAAQHLSKSAKGRDALKALLAWLDDTGLALDQSNQEAALTLLEGAWGPFPGTARDEMREALDAKAKGHS